MKVEVAEETPRENYILLWLTAAVIFAAIAAIYLYVPTEKDRRPGSTHHVLSYPFRLAFLFRILCGFPVQHIIPVEKGKRMGYLRPRFRRDRSDFLFAGTHHRTHLGEAYLGGLVGLGCAFDLDTHPLADLCRLSHAQVAGRSGLHAGAIRRSSRDCRVS